MDEQGLGPLQPDFVEKMDQAPVALGLESMAEMIVADADGRCDLRQIANGRKVIADIVLGFQGMILRVVPAACLALRACLADQRVERGSGAKVENGLLGRVETDAAAGKKADVLNDGRVLDLRNAEAGAGKFVPAFRQGNRDAKVPTRPVHHLVVHFIRGIDDGIALVEVDRTFSGQSCDALSTRMINDLNGVMAMHAAADTVAHHVTNAAQESERRPVDVPGDELCP